jgi:signal transduction histidine kinase
VLWLLLSYSLTVISFVTSTVIGELRSQGINEAADAVIGDALPSITHLARARTEVRQLEVLVLELTGRLGRHQDVSDLRLRLLDSRRGLEQEWRTYLSLPESPGERELWPGLALAHRQLVAGLRQLFERSWRADAAGAVQVLNQQIRPALDRMDAGFSDAIQINDTDAARQARRIARLRASARHSSMVLDSLSVALSLLGAALLARLLRHHTGLLHVRMTELEHFAGRVAHDIRNPLAAVGLTLELARRDAATTDRIQGVLERGSRSLQRIGALVDGLLLFARSGAAPGRGDHTDVCEVVAGVTEEMQEAAKAKEITLEVEPFVGRPSVGASAGVVISLVSNLVGNAIKYMGPGQPRRVTVRVRSPGSRKERAVRVEVQDTGVGVPEEQRRRVFDPYVRAAQASIPGLGLGLATVRRLAEAHGGRVGLESPAGGGSVFWFELPALKA